MPRGQANAEKTHCPAGHPLTGDNVRISKRATGERRVCKRCVRESARRRYEEKAGA